MSLFPVTWALPSAGSSSSTGSGLAPRPGSGSARLKLRPVLSGSGSSGSGLRLQIRLQQNLLASASSSFNLRPGFSPSSLRGNAPFDNTSSRLLEQTDNDDEQSHCPCIRLPGL
jgi:hypothetical protein